MSADIAPLLRERLIATKLHAPEADERAVSRSDLFGPFADSAGSPRLMSIVAAAGSGKSTLISQVASQLRGQGSKVAFISLDADDNAPSVFASYFITAMNAIKQPFAERELAMLQSGLMRDHESLFRSILSEISAIKRDCVLILDDVQHLTDPAIVTFLNSLIAHAPQRMRLVFASRTDLPFDLARARVAGSLVEVDQDNLNFTTDQAVSFLEKLHQIELPLPDLEALMESTEGWPTGLQLAAIALRRHRGAATDLISSFSGRDKDLTAYLVESVLKSQPESTRKFLLRTAPLARMNPELCKAVSGHPKSGEMLDHLRRNNLFIIPLDRTGEWYRYHHLFAEFLAAELKRAEPDRYRQICDTARTWCEENGQITEAIQYALQAERFDKAADLIADRAPLVAQYFGDHYTILDWMRRLPEKWRTSKPDIILNHAWSRAFSRDTPMALKLSGEVLSEIERDGGKRWDLDDEDREYFNWFARTIQGVALVCEDNIADGRSLAKQLREDLPEIQPFMITSVSNTIAYADLVSQDLDRSARASADAYAYGQRTGSAYGVVWADFLHALANVEMGRLSTAQEHADRARKTAHAEGGFEFLLSMAGLTNAEIATQRCQFDQTTEHLHHGKRFTNLFGPIEPLSIAMRNEARLEAWTNGIEAARKSLHRGQDIALSTEQPRLYLLLAMEEAVLQLFAGDKDGAFETVRRTDLMNKDHPMIRPDTRKPLREALRVIEARMLIADDRPGEAVPILSTLIGAANTDRRGLQSLTLQTLKAVGLWQSGRDIEATRELDRALTVAAQENHAWPIISAGKPVLAILEAIAERRAEMQLGADFDQKSNFERRLKALLKGENPDTSTGATDDDDAMDELVEPLTDREVEILKLVGAGLANKQLADALLISEPTVKWHLHNIYSKIGVRNRTSAVARARDLELI